MSGLHVVCDKLKLHRHNTNQMYINSAQSMQHSAAFVCWHIARHSENGECLLCAYLGKPACWAKSASMTAAPGSFSEGFSTKVLPAVTAMGNIQRGIMAGKLKGHIPAHTCRQKLLAYIVAPLTHESKIKNAVCMLHCLLTIYTGNLACNMHALCMICQCPLAFGDTAAAGCK